MAAPKKIVTPVTEKKMTPEVKAEAAKPVEVKTTTVKAEPEKETVIKAEPAKKEEPVQSTRGRKPKTAAVSAEKKTTVKKTTAKKEELKSELHIQFSGKSYTEEDLIKIAKDVWKYDLKQKARDLTNIELYVKPEESMVYYVMNKDFTGNFMI